MITIRSSKSLADVALAVEKASAAHGFGVLHVHDLRAKLQGKGLDFPAGCLVFEVCNPALAKAVLDKDMAVSTMLPCRIAVFEKGGEVHLATVEPLALMKLLGSFDADEASQQVDKALRLIMSEAAA